MEWEGVTWTKETRLGNDADVMMVLDVLRVVSNSTSRNIYRQIKRTIVGSGVGPAYSYLLSLRSISDKIAGFVIRDVGLLNRGLVKGPYDLAFPVDTWVKKVAKKLGCQHDADKNIKMYLIDQCKDLSLDPLLVAAGLWFLGYHSLDILIEDCLGKVEINSHIQTV